LFRFSFQQSFVSSVWSSSDAFEMLGMQEGAYSFQKAVVSLIFAIITYQERENGKQTFSSQSYPVHVHV